jgi:hypothetical protein
MSHKATVSPVAFLFDSFFFARLHQRKSGRRLSLSLTVIHHTQKTDLSAQIGFLILKIPLRG